MKYFVFLILFFTFFISLAPLTAQDERYIIYNSGNVIVNFSERCFVFKQTIFSTWVHSFGGIQVGRINRLNTYKGIQLGYFLLSSHDYSFIDHGNYTLDPLVVCFEFFNIHSFFPRTIFPSSSRTEYWFSLGFMGIFGLDVDSKSSLQYLVYPLRFLIMSSSWVPFFPTVAVDAFPTFYLRVRIILPPFRRE